MKAQEERLGSARLGSARLGLIVIVAIWALPPVNPEPGSRPMSRADAAVPILSSIGVMACPSDTGLARNAIRKSAPSCHNFAANGILPNLTRNPINKTAHAHPQRQCQRLAENP